MNRPPYLQNPQTLIAHFRKEIKDLQLRSDPDPYMKLRSFCDALHAETELYGFVQNASPTSVLTQSIDNTLQDIKRYEDRIQRLQADLSPSRQTIEKIQLQTTITVLTKEIEFLKHRHSEQNGFPLDSDKDTTDN